ncbi:MAG: hypothetical protein Q9175_007260 [Cornicularia normoerica]
MFELLTLYAHWDYMNDPGYNVDGMIVNIETSRKPEYSKALRDLITDCVRPVPTERIELDHLRACIQSYRDRVHRKYRKSDDDGRARFESRSLLYYIRNEINNMRTGRWEPYEAKSPTEAEGGNFPDRDWPVVFPRFDDDNDDDDDDGPEAEGGLADHGDSDGDRGDDDANGSVFPSGHVRARKPGAPKLMPQRSMSPQLLDPLFGLLSHQSLSLSSADRIAGTIHPSSGHRLSNPIVIADDTVDRYTHGSGMWRRERTRKSSRSQPGRGEAEHETSDRSAAGSDSSRDKGAGDGILIDRRIENLARLDDAVARTAAGEDGGVKGLAHGLMHAAPDDGTDDESRDMELESDDPLSPPLFAPRALAPTPTATTQAARRAPRRLRNGKIFGYF